MRTIALVCAARVALLDRAWPHTPSPPRLPPHAPHTAHTHPACPHMPACSYTPTPVSRRICVALAVYPPYQWVAGGYVPLYAYNPSSQSGQAITIAGGARAPTGASPTSPVRVVRQHHAQSPPLLAHCVTDADGYCGLTSPNGGYYPGSKLDGRLIGAIECEQQRSCVECLPLHACC